ncbi:MAG: 30S ribosomal protein S6 [Clostridia bacterium]|nr:30S ribosomal protein S6 [Clostridia bacterium]
MRKYELLYIVDNGLTDEEKEKVVLSVKALVENNGGKTEEPDRWGVRKYAYPVNYKQEGYYVLMNFEADDKVPALVSAKLNIDKNIVRHMIVAK